MSDTLGQAYVQIIPSSKGISGSISNVLNGEAEDAGRKGGNKYIGALKKVMAGAAVGKWIGDALSAGGDLEQSLGGIETLYKDSADKMKEYASQAYMTAGVDANTYMEQVTSYSAGLITAMDRDVSAAADVANMAMLDMADNANKLGTPLESIQNAYQGFSKQNYTMLDNLKLGYGGTKSEMERLLRDAEKFSGVKYDINNLDDVYNAIHVIQEEMDITGTTAKEAASTIKGSVGMWKASYKDLIANLALGEDIYPQLEALVESSIAVLKNVIPAIWHVFSGIPMMLVQHWPEITGAIKEMIQKMVDTWNHSKNQWLQMGALILSDAAQGLIEKIPDFLNKLADLIRKVVSFIVHNIPQIVATLGVLTGKIVAYLFEAMPRIVKSALNLLLSILGGVGKLIVTAIKAPFIWAWNHIKSLYGTIGKWFAGKVSDIKSSCSGVWDAITAPFRKAYDKIVEIINKIKNFFPISVGKIFTNIQVPSFSMTNGDFNGGKPARITTVWHAKAENQPYLFTRATLFGAGERNDELLYGRQQLMRDIKEASGGGQIIINLNYDAGSDAQEMVSDIARGLKRYRMAGAF